MVRIRRLGPEIWLVTSVLKAGAHELKNACKEKGSARIAIIKQRRLYMIDLAYAGAPSQGDGGAAGLIGFLPLILVFVIFYFLLIRPQQKRQKEHRVMLENLKRGDQVVTNGGIYGTVTKIRNDVVHLEIAEKVRVRVQKPAIASILKGGEKLSTENEPEEIEDQKKS